MFLSQKEIATCLSVCWMFIGWRMGERKRLIFFVVWTWSFCVSKWFVQWYHQPNSRGLYTPYKDSLLKVAWPFSTLLLLTMSWHMLLMGGSENRRAPVDTVGSLSHPIISKGFICMYISQVVVCDFLYQRYEGRIKQHATVWQCGNAKFALNHASFDSGNAIMTSVVVVVLLLLLLLQHVSKQAALLGSLRLHNRLLLRQTYLNLQCHRRPAPRHHALNCFFLWQKWPTSSQTSLSATLDHWEAMSCGWIKISEISAKRPLQSFFAFPKKYFVLLLWGFKTKVALYFLGWCNKHLVGISQATH